MKVGMLHVATIGLTGALQTMGNLLSKKRGVQKILGDSLRSKALKAEVEGQAQNIVNSTVYARYSPEVYQRTRALYDAIAWIPTPKAERESPEAPSMMLTVMYRGTGYKPWNFAYPKTKKHGTAAKLGGGGTYAKFFLPKFQPSFLKPAETRVRDFFSIWKDMIPPVVINKVSRGLHVGLKKAKVGV